MRDNLRKDLVNIRTQMAFTKNPEELKQLREELNQKKHEYVRKILENKGVNINAEHTEHKRK